MNGLGWGCFSIMASNPGGNPNNSGLVIDPEGAVKLYCRKLHPWENQVRVPDSPSCGFDLPKRLYEGAEKND